MNDSEIRITQFGSAPVPVLRREWQRAPLQPYRRTYDLMPGQSWFDAETTDKQREHYALNHDGIAVPVGAMVARELKAEGADEAAFMEIWGGGKKAQLVDEDLVCVAQLVNGMIDCLDSHAETGRLLAPVIGARGGLAGFPDVIAVFPDGRIALREVKRARKDAVQETQHAAADRLRELFGRRLDLALVEWD